MDQKNTTYHTEQFIKHVMGLFPDAIFANNQYYSSGDTLYDCVVEHYITTHNVL